MSTDGMDIDLDVNGPSSKPKSMTSPEKKRKQKSKEMSPSKKRRHETESNINSPSKIKKSSSKETKDRVAIVREDSDPNSPFNLVTATLYLPLSPISISPTHALASLLAEHLSPLLLTYYPPFKGIVMAYSNASLSDSPSPSRSKPEGDIMQPLTLATTANEYGVLYVYLTATFLVLSPRKGQELEGWINVQSEGFLGAIVYNLFSVGIDRRRLPPDWVWVPPGADDEQDRNGGTKRTKAKKIRTGDFDSEKEHFTPLPRPINSSTILDATMADTENEDNDDDDFEETDTTGYFQSVSGHRVRGTIKFRVRDVDVIPGADPDRGFMSIEGTMLSPDEETRLLEAERSGRLPLPSTYRRADATAMTGANRPSRSGTIDQRKGDDEEAIDIEVEQVPGSPTKTATEIKAVPSTPSSMKEKKEKRKEKKEKRDKKEKDTSRSKTKIKS